jgi:hypothetical protein
MKKYKPKRGELAYQVIKLKMLTHLHFPKCHNLVGQFSVNEWMCFNIFRLSKEEFSLSPEITFVLMTRVFQPVESFSYSSVFNGFIAMYPFLRAYVSTNSSFKFSCSDWIQNNDPDRQLSGVKGSYALSYVSTKLAMIPNMLLTTITSWNCYCYMTHFSCIETVFDVYLTPCVNLNSFQ